MTTKHPIYYFLIALIGYILGLICMDSGHCMHDDFALYLEQAKAIVMGNMESVYKVNVVCMEQAGSTTGPDIYPMGYPLLISPLFLFFNDPSWLVLKAFTFSFYFLFLFGFYKILQLHRLDNKMMLVLFCLVAFNYHLIRFSDWLYADIPFLGTSMMGLWLTLRQKQHPSFLQMLFLAFILSLNTLIKSQGILLLIVSTVYLFQHSKTRIQSIIIPLTFIGIKMMMDTLFPYQDSQYLSLLGQINVSGTVNNILYYIKELGALYLFHRLPSFILMINGLIICGLIAWSLYKHFKTYPLLSSFFIAHLALCVVWPSFQGMRLLFPILPLIWFFTLSGLQDIFKTFISISFSNKIMYLLLGFNSLVCLITVHHYWQKDTDFYTSTPMIAITDYIQNHIHPEETIAFVRPRGLRYILDSRHPITQDPNRASYVLKDSTHLEPAASIMCRSQNWVLIQK